MRYNSLKTAAKAEGELKAQLDEVDKAIAEARRSGNNGEVRRQIAKGMALLNKEAWTPQLDYRNSLVLRSERTVMDSTRAVCDSPRADLPAGDRTHTGAHDEGVDSQARAAGAAPGHRRGG